MRKIIRAKLKEKARQFAKIRKQLVKKHQQFVAKLRREQKAALNKVRREFGGSTTKRKTTAKRRKTTTAKRRKTTTARRRTQVKYNQPTAKVVAFKRRRRTTSRRRSYRKAA